MKSFVFSFVLAVLALASSAQTEPRGYCGTEPVDMDVLQASKSMGQQLVKSGQLSKMTTYIPIRFKIIGKTDSTEAASPNSILDLMTAINVDFAPLGIKFFLENSGGIPWDSYYNDDFFNNHAAQGTLLTRFRSTNAISIFVPNEATPAGSTTPGVTLGYYSPARDILVFKKSEVGNNASTASHEIGHFFSLPHTFRGWDCCAWNGNRSEGCSTPEINSPVMITRAPCSNQDVELVTRGNGANCETAGDTFCDTPADYNLGFGWSNCNYTGNVQDRNGEVLRPDENNFMGYFLSCNPYSFSLEQRSTIIGNYNLANRSFLRGVSPGTFDSITTNVNWVQPATDNAISQFSDQIRLDWEDVPNAQYYYVEVATRSSFSPLFYSAIVSESTLLLTGTSAGTTYNYRVRPFSQVSFSNVQAPRRVTAGAFSSGINATPQAAKSVVVSPNPVKIGENLQVKIASDFSGDANITVRDLTGRVVLTQTEFISAGDNQLSLVASTILSSGTYVLTLSTSKGISTRKFVVQ